MRENASQGIKVASRSRRLRLADRAHPTDASDRHVHGRATIRTVKCEREHRVLRLVLLHERS